MSYKTPPQSLRYGFSSDWSYKGVGPVKNSLMAQKIGQYIGNVVNFVVPPTPKRTRTRGVAIKKLPSQPGIQGKTVVIDTATHTNIIIYFYLNFTELSEEQSRTLELNFIRILLVSSAELGSTRVFFCNYYDFFFFTQLANTKGASREVRKHIKAFFKSRPNSKFAVEIGKQKIKAIRMLSTGIARFKRQQYVKRSFRPLAAAFFFNECDSELIVRVIAFELQTLRVFHKRFVNFVRTFFKVWIKPWSDSIRIVQGIQLAIKGRITPFRRQVRRASSKHFRFGIVKKAHLITEVISSQAIAHNRYGSISVTINCEIKKRISKRWEEANVESPLNQFIYRKVNENAGPFYPHIKYKFSKFKNEHYTPSNNIYFADKYTTKFHKIWNFNRYDKIHTCSLRSLHKAPSISWLLRPISYLIEHRDEMVRSQGKIDKTRINKKIKILYKYLLNEY